ncbi:MAG: NAD(P)-binding domain-containing protein, partial [Desulfuromonadales bacterium]|nr:NAD(P)-binding domain-containing protein [Desulfuromonadales bacterium]
MVDEILNIGVLGAGSWGTTLANMLAKNGYRVTLWAYEPDLVERMAEQRINDLYLSGIELSPELFFTNSLEEAVEEKQLILSVVPSQVLRGVLEKTIPFIQKDAIIVSASKGIEVNTLKLVSQIFEEFLTEEQYQNFVILSGPSFAREVAKDMPTAVVVASNNLKIAKRVQAVFSSEYFRVYTNDDVIGVELCGA